MEGHKIILYNFLKHIENENITSILDAGSGRTSLSIITDSLPHTLIDAVVYPGDVRKLSSILDIAHHHKNVSAIEKDICSDSMDKEYDLIVAHLLLGEAAKFGNTFEALLNRIITMKYKYLIIIDYLEDPAVKEDAILEMCGAKGLTVVCKSCITNEQPQVWEDFTGVHNFGYLIKSS